MLGQVFAGTATGRRTEMATFVEDARGLERVELGGVDADAFAMPVGFHLVVAEPRGKEAPLARSDSRSTTSIGRARSSVAAAVDEPAGNDRQRYAHFRAPDGRLDELVEDRVK